MLAFYWVQFRFILYLTYELRRNCVLYKLLSLFGVHSVIDLWLKQAICVGYFTKSIFWAHSVIYQWLKQTLCVRYFTEFIWCKFGIGPWIWIQIVFDQWINQTLYVSYFTGYKYGTFGNWYVITVDTMCYLLY